MDFRILGPLEVSANGERLALGGPKQRALLAILLLNADRVVSRDRLIEALWAEEPPRAARHAVEVNVSRLRKALGASNAGDSALVTRAPGYVLHVEPGELDLQRFERLLAEGRRARADGEPERAADALRDAESQWRGRPLADLEYEPFARVDIERLEELRLVAIEERIEAELALGRDGELVSELRQLTREHPWRERLHAQLMLALYRSGRQADALEAFGRAREVLVEQLGIEPGAELADLHQAMLVQDRTLDAPGLTVTPLSGRRSSLPAPPNRTIGRDRELVAVGERLRASSVRLLTLTGPGGVGKTRLALEAARAVEADFADGAHLVSLAAVARPQDVPAAIVESLAIMVLAGESAERAVERFLAAKHLLLVVDNCEHLPAAAPFIGGLPAACPTVTVLATSREPLNVQAEQRYPVSPLALPVPGRPAYADALAGVDAVALFCERARAYDPAFALGDGNAVAVAEICRRVDGLPLGIELAAARCGLLSPGEIAERLDAALGALGAGARDAPARQRTLRATIDWSHDLLSDPEKACFACFAVFAGGATVEAAATITGTDLDTLDRLVAKSLLSRRQQAHAPTRLGMLETIRAYATERFAAIDDVEAVRERHYRYFLALAERHGTDRALMGADGKQHLARLDAEVENLHAALEWAVNRRDGGRAIAAVVAVGRYWWMRDRYAQAVSWIDRALSLPGVDDHPTTRLRALCIRELALWPLGRGAERPQALAELEAAARALGAPAIVSHALLSRAFLEISSGRLDLANASADDALNAATASGDEWAIAQAASGKASAASTLEQLRERVDRAASLLADVGNLYQLANLLSSAAYNALCLGGERDANQLADRAMPITHELDNPYLSMMLCGNFGLAALFTGDPDAARHAFRAQLELCRELVVPPVSSEGLLGLAAIAVARDDLDRAARLFGASDTQRYGQPTGPVETRLDATCFQPARDRLGVHTWNAALREGAALNFNEAIAYALEQSDPRDAPDAASRPTAVSRTANADDGAPDA
jgi:predicted ATPase/DNA-binding SARP family transcriptional activator